MHSQVIATEQEAKRTLEMEKKNGKSYVFAACLPFPNAAPKYFCSGLQSQ